MIDPSRDFSENVKLEARKRAAFKCCLCRDVGDEVHHLKPRAQGGSNDIDNAILLCVRCHDRYGSRPEKRKFLTQARDAWYEVVRDMYSPEGLTTAEQLQDMATKHDITGLAKMLAELAEQVRVGLVVGSTSPQQAANVASTMISSITITSGAGTLALQGYAPQVAVSPSPVCFCISCGRSFSGDRCPNCGDPYRSA